MDTSKNSICVYDSCTCLIPFILLLINDSLLTCAKLSFGIFKSLCVCIFAAKNFAPPDFFYFYYYLQWYILTVSFMIIYCWETIKSEKKIIGIKWLSRLLVWSRAFLTMFCKERKKNAFVQLQNSSKFQGSPEKCFKICHIFGIRKSK